jgi:hypothetical protein
MRKDIVIDLINALSGNNSVKMVQHATVEEAMFFLVRDDVKQQWVVVM